MRLCRPFGVVLLLAALPALTWAAGPPETGPDRLKIAASIYPIAMIAMEIGGDRVEVTTVIRPGTDPHHFELNPSSARAVYESDALFMIGADFDAQVMGDGTAHTRARVEFYRQFSDSLLPLGDTFNPHFWLDPMFARAMGETIGLTLAGVDSANSAYYEKMTRVFCARIDSLNARTKEGLAASGFDAFVSYHPAWTYFARRYGLDEIAVVEKYPENEPSARWVADLIREIQRRGVRFLIVEKASDPGVVSGIAHDTSVEVLVLDPLGDPDDPARRTYFGLIDYNAALLENAARGD
jgi:zinc transport system substrate-binding protein